MTHPRAEVAYAWAYEHLLYPTWQRVVHGRPISAELALLERSQWRDPAAIEEEQLASLRALLAYAGERVPYYREIFAQHRFDPRGVRSRADLCALPVLTREIIRERYDDLVDPGHRGRNIHKGTSGTTGTPLKFEYSTESETWRQATRLRAYRWAGYHMGRPTLHYWGAGDMDGHTPAKVRVDRALRREVYVDSVQQEEPDLRRALEVLRALRPHVIVAYTQPLALFARWIEEHDLRDWEDIPVICGAEAVLPADRAAIERTFGPAFETYGSRETMLLAAECERHDGMHLSEENLLVEIANGGAPAPEGETGDVLVTDLHNHGMPMIRYQNGDVAVMARGACRCDRGLRRFARVEGRRADTLHDREGRPIPGILFLALIATRADLYEQFRVVQRPSGEVTLEIVRGPGWSPAAFAPVERAMREHLRGLPFETVLVSSIPPGPTGKHRPIVVLPAAAPPA